MGQGRWRRIRLVAIAALVLGLAVPASAQTSRTITVILVNFQDDRSEPQTPDQVRASIVAEPSNPNSTSFGTLLHQATNGLATLTVNVLPRYFTLSENKSCAPNQTTARNMATAAGYTLTGTAWVYSPTTFGTCSERDRLGLSVHGSFTNINFPFYGGLLFGLNAISWQWRCKDPSGAWVTISDSCGADGLRNFRLMLGQAWGPMSPHGRVLLNSMSADRVRVVTLAQAPSSLTIAPLNVVPPTGAIQAVTISDCKAATALNGVTLAYYATTQFRDTVPESSGLTMFVAGTENLLDGTPDGETRPGMGTHALRPGSSFLCANGLRVTAGAITSAGISVSFNTGAAPPPDPEPLPPPPSCTSTPQPVVDVQNLIAPDCASWSVDGGPYYAVRRNGTNTGADAFNLSMCSGVLYARSRSGQFYEWTGTGWRGRTTANPCGTTPPPPPPPPDPCIASPLVPVVSITAPEHTLRWPSFLVTDERNCTATVPAKP